MKNSDDHFRKCSDADIRQLLSPCPEVLEKMMEMGRIPLIDAYDSVLFSYGMHFCVFPVYKNDNNDAVAYFGYQYAIGKDRYEMEGNQGCRTRAEAQLVVVHETMYELRRRIRNAS